MHGIIKKTVLPYGRGRVHNVRRILSWVGQPVRHPIPVNTWLTWLLFTPSASGVGSAARGSNRLRQPTTRYHPCTAHSISEITVPAKSTIAFQQTGDCSISQAPGRPAQTARAISFRLKTARLEVWRSSSSTLFTSSGNPQCEHPGDNRVRHALPRGGLYDHVFTKFE